MEVLPEWAAIAIREAPIAYGIAIVENAAREAAIIEGAEPEDFYETDARLLKTAKGCVPKLPFEQIDVLAVERLGKNISGTGMDPAVTARFDIRGRPNPPAPVISKLVVLGLTPETHGNGLGVGNADYTTKEVADSLDLYAMYMNACTATFTERVRIPAVLATDKAALQAAVGTSWHLDGADARLCLIRRPCTSTRSWSRRRSPPNSTARARCWARPRCSASTMRAACSPAARCRRTAPADSPGAGRYTARITNQGRR